MKSDLSSVSSRETLRRGCVPEGLARFGCLRRLGVYVASLSRSLRLGQQGLQGFALLEAFVALEQAGAAEHLDRCIAGLCAFAHPVIDAVFFELDGSWIRAGVVETQNFQE